MAALFLCARPSPKTSRLGQDAALTPPRQGLLCPLARMEPTLAKKRADCQRREWHSGVFGVVERLPDLPFAVRACLSELLDLGEMGVYSFYTVLLCYNISGCIVLPSPGVAMKISDPFLSSLMAQTSLRRLAGIVAILVPLWLMIAWAVSLP